MKIAITGKGGSGKTTLTSGLAIGFKDAGSKVLVVDCDPDANLALTLGFPKNLEITPISQMKQLIAERTESSSENPSLLFKINPKVDDIPEKFAPEHEGVRLLVMGKVKKAAGGCLCPENTFIKRLIAHLLLNLDEVVILDMVAGTEHLGRATASGVDIGLIVSEPTTMGLETAKRTDELLKDLGIEKRFFVGNKIERPDDKDFLNKNLSRQCIGFIGMNKTLKDNRGVFVADEVLKDQIRSIREKLVPAK